MKDKLYNVKNGASSLGSRIDSQVTARRNIGQRISKVNSALHNLEQRLGKLDSFITQSMEKYEQTEQQLTNRGQALGKPLEVSSYPNYPGVDWSKVPDGMKQQLLDSIRLSEQQKQQKYNVEGIDWGLVSPTIRDQLKASIDLAAAQRTINGGDKTEVAAVSPDNYKDFLGTYDWEQPGVNKVYFIDKAGNKVVIDYDRMQELRGIFNLRSNIHTPDIWAMTTDITPFLQYVVEQGYDPRTFESLNDQDQEIALAYIQARLLLSQNHLKSTREWQSEAIEWLPFIGSAKTGTDLGTGKNNMTGEELTGIDYGVEALGLLGPLGKLAENVVTALIKKSDDILDIVDDIFPESKVDDLVEGAGQAKPKIYSADGNPDLRATRRPAFDEMKNTGVNLNGQTFTMNEHAYNSLFKSGRKDIMPDDIKDALATKPKPAEAGSVEYVNPASGTSVFVNPGTNQIVGVWPSSFKR